MAGSHRCGERGLRLRRDDGLGHPPARWTPGPGAADSPRPVRQSLPPPGRAVPAGGRDRGRRLRSPGDGRAPAPAGAPPTARACSPTGWPPPRSCSRSARRSASAWSARPSRPRARVLADAAAPRAEAARQAARVERAPAAAEARGPSGAGGAPASRGRRRRRGHGRTAPPRRRARRARSARPSAPPAAAPPPSAPRRARVRPRLLRRARRAALRRPPGRCSRRRSSARSAASPAGARATRSTVSHAPGGVTVTAAGARRDRRADAPGGGSRRLRRDRGAPLRRDVAAGPHGRGLARHGGERTQDQRPRALLSRAL